MNFNEVMESISTTAKDVEGIQKIMHPIVRRKVPAGYVADVRKKKKKKEEEEKNEAFEQIDPARLQLYMTKFWRKGNGKIEKPEKKKEEDDEEEIEEMHGVTDIVDPNFKNKAIEPFWEKGKKKENDDEEDEEDEELE